MSLTTPDPPPSPADDSWRSFESEAKRVDLHPETLRRAAAAGRLRAYKVGNGRLWRTRPSYTDAWVRGE